MKNADEAELKLLASQPQDITVHNVLDFPQLATLAGLLSRLICQKIQGWSLSRAAGEGAGMLPGLPSTWDRGTRKLGLLRGTLRGSAWPPRVCKLSWGPDHHFPPATTLAPAAPALDALPMCTSLVLGQVTPSSIRVSWTPAPQPPLEYLIVWWPSRGGARQEVSGTSFSGLGDPAGFTHTEPGQLQEPGQPHLGKGSENCSCVGITGPRSQVTLRKDGWSGDRAGVHVGTMGQSRPEEVAEG